MVTKSALFTKRFCKDEVSPFDFKYCVLLIYRLKVSDRAAGFATLGLHKNYGGLSMFSLEKVLIGI